MNKTAIAVAALLLTGGAGSLWAADLNPQPLPPGSKLSDHDQAQISGNLNGDGKTGGNVDKWQKGMEKPQTGLKKGSGLIKSGATGGGGAGKAGFQDLHHGGKGTQKILIGLDKANGLKKASGLQKGSGLIKGEAGFQKSTGMQKSGISGTGNQLPAVH